MFLVICVSPLDEVWEERDALIRKAAGRHADLSGACSDGINPPQRDHCWYIPTFPEALELKKQLELVTSTKTTIRERSTQREVAVPVMDI